MKRDWDLIREVLIEVEELDTHTDRQYHIKIGSPADSDAKAEHALLLYKSGFIEGVDSGGLNDSAIIARELTWDGHDLLQTMRSQPVWEQIKSIAQQKGIELTFDAVKAIGKIALGTVLAT